MRADNTLRRGVECVSSLRTTAGNISCLTTEVKGRVSVGPPVAASVLATLLLLVICD